MSNIPLLTRGPLALFFGGQEIIPSLSQASVKSSNMPFYLLVVLSIVLQLSLAAYKKYRFKKAISYEQQLFQTTMSGVRNVYGTIIIFTGFLACVLVLIIHLFMAKKHNENKAGKNPALHSAYGAAAMLAVVSLINFTPFLNPRLRFYTQTGHLYENFFSGNIQS